jgi:uncharacterized RDD family membrane protein YckC
VSQLVTGEAVALDLQTAGVPSRILAALLDGIAQAVLVYGFVLVVIASNPSAATAGAFVIIGIVLGGIAYPVLLETLLSGRTLGKMALGLRVVRDDGGPIGLRHALVRGLIGFFVERPGVTSGSAAVICALVNPQGKRLGDLAAGTIVVQERVARTQTVTVQMPPPLAAWAATLDLSRLPDELAQRARAYLTRWASLTPAAQAEVGSRLAGEVAALVTPAPPPGVPAWAYLSAVVAERRRRAQEASTPAVAVAPTFWHQDGTAAAPAAAPPPAPPASPSPEPPGSPFAPPS